MYKSKIIDKQYIGEHLNPHPHLERLERLFLVHYCGFTIDHTLLKWEGITDFVALPSVTWSYMEVFTASDFWFWH